MTKTIASRQQTTIVGTRSNVQQIALRRIDRANPIGRPSERRTTRRPVTRKLAVLPRRHSTTLQTSQPTTNVRDDEQHREQQRLDASPQPGRDQFHRNR